VVKNPVAYKNVDIKQENHPFSCFS